MCAESNRTLRQILHMLAIRAQAAHPTVGNSQEPQCMIKKLKCFVKNG